MQEGRERREGESALAPLLEEARLVAKESHPVQVSLPPHSEF